MAATTAEGIGSGTIPVQIMAPSTEQPIQVSSSQVLPDTLSESITTTLQSISQQRAPATAIATVSLPETVPNADCVSVGSGENAVHAVSGEGITHEQAQNILHTTTSEVMDENMDQEQHHTVSAQETIMIPSENVNIVTSNTDPMQIVSVPSNLPPWAARLHDCELIGDSYRGYVTNEVELDLILTLHKQNTNSCWGTRQSPSSAKPSIRLMWKSQYVPYDGIPFLNTGEYFLLFSLLVSSIGVTLKILLRRSNGILARKEMYFFWICNVVMTPWGGRSDVCVCVCVCVGGGGGGGGGRGGKGGFPMVLHVGMYCTPGILEFLAYTVSWLFTLWDPIRHHGHQKSLPCQVFAYCWLGIFTRKHQPGYFFEFLVYHLD